MAPSAISSVVQRDQILAAGLIAAASVVTLLVAVIVCGCCEKKKKKEKSPPTVENRAVETKSGLEPPPQVPESNVETPQAFQASQAPQSSMEPTPQPVAEQPLPPVDSAPPIRLSSVRESSIVALPGKTTNVGGTPVMPIMDPHDMPSLELLGSEKQWRSPPRADREWSVMVDEGSSADERVIGVGGIPQGRQRIARIQGRPITRGPTGDGFIILEENPRSVSVALGDPSKTAEVSTVMSPSAEFSPRSGPSAVPKQPEKNPPATFAAQQRVTEPQVKMTSTTAPVSRPEPAAASRPPDKANFAPVPRKEKALAPKIPVKTSSTAPVFRSSSSQGSAKNAPRRGSETGEITPEKAPAEYHFLTPPPKRSAAATPTRPVTTSRPPRPTYQTSWTTPTTSSYPAGLETQVRDPMPTPQKKFIASKPSRASKSRSPLRVAQKSADAKLAEQKEFIASKPARASESPSAQRVAQESATAKLAEQNARKDKGRSRKSSKPSWRAKGVPMGMQDEPLGNTSEEDLLETEDKTIAEEIP